MGERGEQSKKKKKKKGGGAEKKEEKSCAHDTSQPHYTMEGRARACSPAALTMIRLPRSRTPSPSSGSHQDSHDLMMREGGGGRGGALIIHTRQTSPLATLPSRTQTHTRDDKTREKYANKKRRGGFLAARSPQSGGTS